MNIRTTVSILILSFVCGSCRENTPPGKEDTPLNGTIEISVDESFKPVIEEQIAMYEASYPGTKINAHYKPEAECLKDFFTDSATRLIIITRALTEQEDKYMSDSLQYFPKSALIASDAVAVIIHPNNDDSLFTLKRLQQQLLGKINREQTIVFDGLSATSTVRFVTDSVLKGAMFDTSVVKAAKTSIDVIDYVAANSNAIGLIGINWIGNPELKDQVERLKKVKIAYVQCDLCEDKPFVKPMQESIDSYRYPLVRGLYYVMKENYMGLGTGFTSFLRYERGQLIFKRAYLGTRMDFELRNVKLNEKIPQN